MRELLCFYAFLAVFLLFYLNLPKFGHLPDKISREKIKRSKHVKNGKFHNMYPTVQMTAENGLLCAIADFLFVRHPNTKPKKNLPAVKTDLRSLDENRDLMIWFGHSSYYIQLNGLRFLIDPVFSKRASPVPFKVVSFKGTDIYRPEDMPEIDFILITHDHWDHLDYPTVLKMMKKTKRFITGLGIGSHLRHWGVENNKISELDWNESVSFDGISIDCLPARHFSGRSIFSNRSLWVSFLIRSSDYKLYASGDSGYDNHYGDIGNRFDGVDLALLECGQYDKNWREIHQFPEKTVQAAQDLRAKRIFAGHNSRFCICNHPWFDPLLKVSDLAEKNNLTLLTPKIGEVVNLREMTFSFDQWWKDVLP